MPAVNPKILQWARETAGLAPSIAAAKVGLRPAWGLSAVQRLEAFERGESEPTEPVLAKMANQYRRPLITFYLPEPPRRANRGADFRTLRGDRSIETDAFVDALLRDMRTRQSMVRALLEAEDEAEDLPFVGCLASARDHTQSLEATAARSLQALLGPALTVGQYYAQNGPRNAFSLLRERVEHSGIFVLLQGTLGSHHTDLPLELFRGFVIADSTAPFIVINDRDSPAAWSFTLLHELVHLMLGHTGISGADVTHDIEALCSRISGAWMSPRGELEKLLVDEFYDLDDQRTAITEFAKSRNISCTMVTYSLFRSGRINEDACSHHCKYFRNLWHLRKTLKKNQKGMYFSTQRHRIGNQLCSLAQRMIVSRALPTTKAAIFLGVKPTTVGTLLRITSLRQAV